MYYSGFKLFWLLNLDLDVCICSFFLFVVSYVIGYIPIAFNLKLHQTGRQIGLERQRKKELLSEKIIFLYVCHQ